MISGTSGVSYQDLFFQKKTRTNVINPVNISVVAKDTYFRLGSWLSKDDAMPVC